MASNLIRLLPIPDDTHGYRADGGCDDCNATSLMFHKGATVVTAVTHAETCPALHKLPR